MKVAVVPLIVGVLGTILESLVKSYKNWKPEELKLSWKYKTEESAGILIRLAAIQ